MTCLANFVETRLAPRHTVERPSPSAMPLNRSDSAPSSDLEADLRSALAFFHVDDRTDWIKTGQALKPLDECGKLIWFKWSAQSSKFNDGRDDPEKIWASFTADRTGYAAIFAEAQRRGWHNPGTHYAAQVPPHAGATAFGDRFRAGFAADTAPQSNVVSFRQFTGEFVAPIYVWHRVLQTGSLYAFTALWGGGKTAIALTIALHVATGRELGGHPTISGKALFLCGENPEDVKLRVMAACNLFEIDPAELTDRIFFTRRPFNIDQPEALRQFAAEAEPHGPFALCFVDTGPAHSSAEDENDNRQMHALAMALRGLMASLGNPATIVLMHPAKGAQKDTLQPRGGGSFSGSIDGELCAWNERGIIEFFHRLKFRGPGFKPIRFELQRHTFPDILDNFDEPAISIVAVPTDREPQARVRLTNADNIALGALASCREVAVAPPQAVLDVLPTCGGQSFFPPLQVVPEAIWRDACYQHGISSGEQSAKAAAFRRSLSKLVDLKQVHTAAGHFWLNTWLLPSTRETEPERGTSHDKIDLP